MEKYKTEKFSTIIHLSDLHIRLYKRHSEYEIVFDRLISSLEKWKAENPARQACITLCGDLVHAKTDLSPEMVSLLSKLLTNLSQIYPVIVIAGNHDLNLANPHRMDSLSPIIENLKLDNLFYLKNSGIYELGNINFHVFSVLGLEEDWPVIDSSRKGYNVGLFHGQVYNAETDMGYKITNRHVEVKTFDGLEMVLMGDIHRYQVLQFYTPTQHKPVVAYAGSLIQQNYGETLDYHGWLEWDLSTKDHKFYQIRNDWGYVTLQIKDNKCDIPNNLPKNIRLRLIVDTAEATTIKKALAVIKKKYNVSEYTVNRTVQSASATQNTGTQHDIHNVSYQNELLREFIEQKYPGTADEFLDKIYEINKQLNSQIQEDELPRNINWKPVKLKFDNLFSYGKGNVIDFENLQGLYGVFSPNATGKTSAFDALCFALYDKTPRAFKGSHIMNTRENECSCEFIFDIGTERYRILRKGSRRQNGEVKVDVEFMRKTDDDWLILSGDDRRDTNAIIRSYVGSYEDFVLTNLSVQNQNALFIDKGQTERKDLLSQFMGLTIFDRLFDLASNEIKEVQGSLKRFSKDDFTTQLADIQNNLEQNTTEYKNWKEKQNKIKGEIDSINQNIVKLVEQKVPVNVTQTDIKYLTLQLDHHERILEVNVKDVEQLETKKYPIQKKIDELKTELVDEKELKQKIKELKTASKELPEFETSLKVLNSKMETWKEKQHWLENHEYDPNCKYCVNNAFVVDAKNAINLIQEHSSELDIISDHIIELRQKKETLDELQSQLEHVMWVRRALDQQEKALLQVELEVEKNKNLKTDIEKNLQHIQSEIEAYYKNESDIKKNKKLDEKVDEEKKKLAEESAKYKEAEQRVQEYHGQMQVLSSKKQDLLKNIKEAEELETVYEAFECYLSAVCRNGIPYGIISKTIPHIQTLVNNILAQIVEFSVVLEVDGKNINGNIVYDDDRRWPLELASGMEKFVTGLAIRVALMSVSNLPRSNFLILDEGLGVLDSDNLSSMFMLFNMLRTEFEFIILISHLEVVRDVADTLVEIKRENGYSYITID